MPGEYVRLTDLYSSKQIAYLSNIHGTRRQIRYKIEWNLIWNPRSLLRLKQFHKCSWRQAMKWGVHHWVTLITQRNIAAAEADTNIF